MAGLLEVKNLTRKYYEGAVESRVVDQVNLRVEEGEFVMIMGASGSGKTSLLHLIAGIDDPDEGEIRYMLGKAVDFGRMSESARAKFRRTNIGIVFQQQCLIPDLTVYENIMLPVMLKGSRRTEGSGTEHMRERILNLCSQFGLKEHTEKYPSQLSGGQQQRAAILRSVINRPPLLLCDEPTGSLNSAQSRLVMDLLCELNKKGQTVILVTHDVKVAARGSRVVYIEDGHAAGEFTFAEGSCPVSRREEELMGFLRGKGW